MVVGELREEGSKGGIGNSCSGGRIGEGLVLGIGLVLVLLGILARCPKMALLGRVDPPDHVVDAPLVSLAANILLGGLALLGGDVLPRLIQFLSFLVGCILLVLQLDVVCLDILVLHVAAALLAFASKSRGKLELALEVSNYGNEALLVGGL